jgi:hypothetical protein
MQMLKNYWGQDQWTQTPLIECLTGNYTDPCIYAKLDSFANENFKKRLGGLIYMRDNIHFPHDRQIGITPKGSFGITGIGLLTDRSLSKIILILVDLEFLGQLGQSFIASQGS